jgi:hypothetical protein
LSFTYTSKNEKSKSQFCYKFYFKVHDIEI